MAVGKDEEQARDLDLLAAVQQRRERARAQRCQALEHHVEIVEAAMVRAVRPWLP